MPFNLKIKFLMKMVSFVLDKINESEGYRAFVISLGAELRDLIPGDDIEEELGETLELFKLGLVKGKDANDLEDEEVKEAISLKKRGN